MKRKISTLAVVAAAWLAVAAWDTRVIAHHTWLAIYQEAPSTTLPEHTHVSDQTFDHIDPSGNLRRLFGRGGSATLDVVDLNASYFRIDELADSLPAGDDPDTEVEERRIPPPGLFSGLPDYSYGLYDWLNKNTTCPAFADGNYAGRCHEFMGWLGALNSVHFGSQAAEMYAHHHRNALALAVRAREMRQSMTDAERDLYDDELREAELLALAYEGYAQHFLQDRWSMGHMWERWDAPDPQQEPVTLPAHLGIGALSGLIHGSEALINDHRWMEFLLTRADSMSSPVAGPGSASIPMNYRHVHEGRVGEVTPGIGDERFQDALNNRFSLSSYDPDRADQSLNVRTQIGGLMRCASAGWTEVIRELGQENDGGFGVYGAHISSSAPDFAVIDQDDCWNMWATNESMMIGLLGPNAGQSLALIAATDFAIPDQGPESGVGPAGVVVGGRAELVAYAGRLWLYGRDDPNGTQVARGEMTSFAQSLGSLFGQGERLNPNTIWGFQEGGSYDLPDYAEPIGLITEGDSGPVTVLAEHDARGRDIQTLYGAFTGAQSDYWCENRDVLDELRAEPTARNRQLCERLAGRMYQGTHPSYGGANIEAREFQGSPVRSMCQIRSAGIESDASDDPGNPYWLDQGYVPSSFLARQTDDSRFTDYQAVANWCARVPVITLVDNPELRDENIAATLYVDDERLTLNGYDFGDQPGFVMATPVAGGSARPLEAVISWRDTQLVLDVSDYDWEAGDEYVLTLLTTYESGHWRRGPTVGDFYLRIREPLEIETVTLDLGGVGPCMDPVRDFEIVNLGDTITSTATPEEFASATGAFSTDLAEVRQYFAEQLVCMRTLGAERTEILHRAPDLDVQYVLARRGQYFFRAGLVSSPALAQLVGQTPVDLSALDVWQDHYTTYTEQLEGTIALLDGIDRLIQAWTAAMASDPPLIRGPASLEDMIWSSDSVEDVLATGFEQSPIGNMAAMPRGMPSTTRGEIASALREVSFIGTNVDIRTLSDGALIVTRETLRGLRTWTQVQHALTQSAIPGLEQELNQMTGQTEVILDRALSEHVPEECATLSGFDGCRVFSGDELDSATFYEISDWAGQMSNGIGRPTPLSAGLLPTTYVTPAGHRRAMFRWPSEAGYQAALTGPGEGGARLIGPQDESGPSPK